MCRSTVEPQAQHALAELLRDLAAALCPEAPESVVVGPVDFGAAPKNGSSGSGVSGA